MFKIFSQIWRLTRIAASGPASLFTSIFLVCIIALELMSIWISLRFISWNADFFGALESYDTKQALIQTAFYFTLTAMSALRFLISDYFRKCVLIRWRTALTEHALSLWLADQSYWHLREGFTKNAPENPDQRIAEDCRLFVAGLLGQALDLFTRLVGIFSYVAVLWSLTNFALKFSFLGVNLSIPHYLVWFAFIYVFISSIVIHLLGWRLKDLNFNQQRHEAEFRYSLVQLRDNAAQIALAGGESAERNRLDLRFDSIVNNWRKLMNREFIIGLFRRPYFQTVLRIPLFLSLPAYLAKEVTFGGLMQLASAFSRVTTTLSWFIFSYKSLAEFVATSQRLAQLLDSLEHKEYMPDVVRDINRKFDDKQQLTLQNLVLYTPFASKLLNIKRLTIKQGERIWLHAPSGSGKSTLMRALAGLWPYGTGKISVPNGQLFFASQTPYINTDGIAAALTYPKAADNFKQLDLIETLSAVGLEHKISCLEQNSCAALEGLSNGERQRFIFARILLAKPDWLFLDEPTTGLDKYSEDRLFKLLKSRLPNTTIICIAHYSPSCLDITRTLALADFKGINLQKDEKH